MILFTIYGFMYNGYDGNGRKDPEKYMYMKNKEKINFSNKTYCPEEKNISWIII